MKITILNNQAPFVRGGAEYLADSLKRRLEARGHRTQVTKIPFKWYPSSVIPRHMLACELLDINSGEPDMVIALKFPAYLAPFANKRVWLLHQYRQAYELWGTSWSDIPNTPEGLAVRDMIRTADNASLGSTKHLFTNSHIVARRLKTYNGIDACGVLFPPLDRAELFGPGETTDFFFYPSRQNAGKRQHVAIEAMRHVRSPFHLVLAGRPDSEEYGIELRKKVEEWGLSDRVQFLGWISEEEKARLMAASVAALYLPYDEDSYGYVTLEAFHSHKPVLTFDDSGGVRELIEHERNGLIVPPNAEELAAAMEKLWASREATRSLGAEANATLSRHRIDWDHVLDRLTAAA